MYDDGARTSFLTTRDEMQKLLNVTKKQKRRDVPIHTLQSLEVMCVMAYDCSVNDASLKIMRALLVGCDES